MAQVNEQTAALGKRGEFDGDVSEAVTRLEDFDVEYEDARLKAQETRAAGGGRATLARPLLSKSLGGRRELRRDVAEDGVH